ncbi:MAG TPA: hypothetical protein DHW02_10390, partial [Ktedonobacter sp.]|nr:hypothetical protein [Ktedonobacter sp.]
MNELLRHQRILRGWSQARLAEHIRELGGGADAKMIGKWERGLNTPRPYHIEILCQIFDRNAAELGFIGRGEPAPYPTIVQSRKQAQELELGDTMAKFNPSRRSFLGAAIAGTTLITLSQPGLEHISNYGLQQFESLNTALWGLSNDNQLEMAAQILSVYLPRVTAVVHHASSNRSRAASLAARGYILAAEIDKQDIVAMISHAQNGVFYSEFSEDDNVKCDALRQH